MVRPSDTLPFKFIAQEPGLCENACFVDADFKDLIIKKCAVIRNTPQLSELLKKERPLHNTNVLLDTDQYIAVACDLQDLNHLKTVDTILRREKCSVLFIAEVSMTYMEPQHADAVMQWASQYQNARFCLLEQFLPDGASNPFADTMLRHFQKLKSPIEPAKAYPSLLEQSRRFSKTGWSSVDAKSLWDFWKEDDPQVRKQIDSIEPFDEWEEFVLFASHYFLLVANKRDLYCGEKRQGVGTLPGERHSDKSSTEHELWTQFSALGWSNGMRRHCASFATLNPEAVYVHGGSGSHTRLSDVEIYGRSQPNAHEERQLISHKPPRTELTGHTITEFHGECLLVGGRSSPERASCACYHFDSDAWQRVDDLPMGLYRHCTAAVGDGVLTYGGKLDSTRISDQFYFWRRNQGWSNLAVTGDHPGPRFGASMINMKSGCYAHSPRNRAVLLNGGMNEEGKILDEGYELRLSINDSGNDVAIDCKDITSKLHLTSMGHEAIGRFGATLTHLGEDLLLIGGVCNSGVVRQSDEILLIKPNMTVHKTGAELDPRPLLIGVSAQALPDNTVLLLGEGAVCFSFGPCWNEGIYLVSSQSWELGGEVSWHLLDVSRRQPKPSEENSRHAPAPSKSEAESREPRKTSIAIPTILVRSAEKFKQLVHRSRPAVLKNLDIGPCTEAWTFEYLKNKIGRETLVSCLQ